MIPDLLHKDVQTAKRRKSVSAETAEESGRVYVTFKEYPIASPKYNKSSTDVMIMATVEYPKTALDMFFTPPDVRRSDGQMPEATAVVRHMDAEWLQWSIHPYRDHAWDPAKDDLDVFLLYVDQRFRNGD